MSDFIAYTQFMKAYCEVVRQFPFRIKDKRSVFKCSLTRADYLNIFNMLDIGPFTIQGDPREFFLACVRLDNDYKSKQWINKKWFTTIEKVDNGLTMVVLH